MTFSIRGRASRVAGRALAPLLLAFVSPSLASAQRIVTPTTGPWVSHTRGSSGTSAITGTVPKNGNGSLELHTTGDLNDWGWFDLTSGNPLTSGFGLLSHLDHLSFDWYRGSDVTPNDPVWQGQSVALRLYLRDGTGPNAIFSELVWESWYNGGQTAPRDTWVSEDLTNQVFWRYVNGGYTIADCSSPTSITPGVPIKTATPNAWANGNNCVGTNAEVYGIGIGVGSSWPYQFTGYADDVQLGFDRQLVVNDNFELDRQVTPEPATWVMMLTGLGLVGGIAARRKRFSNS